jgi:hypothetical protein
MPRYRLYIGRIASQLLQSTRICKMFEPGRRGQTSTLSWSHIELIVTQADNVRFQSRMLGANGLDPFHAAQHELKKEGRHNGVDIGIINGRLLGCISDCSREEQWPPHRPPADANLPKSRRAKVGQNQSSVQLFGVGFSRTSCAHMDEMGTSGENGTRVAMPVYGNTLATLCVVPRRA